MIESATRVSWRHIVELANQLESVSGSEGRVDRELALRLARVVLQFQENLLGGGDRARHA